MASPVFPVGVVASETPWEWPRANVLHAALSSAATFAELARICRTWSADRIEAVLERRLTTLRSPIPGSPNGSEFGPPERKKSFYALRDGSTLKQYRVDMIQRAFPRSNIVLWWRHPLAEILCNPQLGIDAIVELLRRLPRGRVRDLVWEEVAFATPGFLAQRLTRWSPGVVSSLLRIGDDVSLFALVSRLRIEQLLGNVDGGLDAAQAAWRILPTAIERRPNLLVSKDALILALDYFFCWQPFADARLFDAARLGISSGRAESVVRCEEIWSANTSIPMSIKRQRRGLVHSGLVPEIRGDWGWWNMLGGPGQLSTAADALS